MAADQANRGKRLVSRGLSATRPSEAFELMDALVQGAARDEVVPHVAAMRLDLQQWLEFYPPAANIPLLDDLRAQQRQRAQRSAAKPSAPQLDLSGLSVDERKARLGDAVRVQVARILQCEPAAVRNDASFADQGVDSLMALEVKNGLETTFGRKLPAALLFIYPTVEPLVEFFLEKLEPAPTAAPVVAAAPPVVVEEGASEAEWDGMTEDEMLAELAKEVASAKQELGQ
jgi:acyl carrier protein